jgi:hypothetical protein
MAVGPKSQLTNCIGDHGKKGTQSCTSPTVDTNDESELYPIALGNEDEIILRPECQESAIEVTGCKIVLGSTLVDNQSLLGEDLTHPL